MDYSSKAVEAVAVVVVVVAVDGAVLPLMMGVLMLLGRRQKGCWLEKQKDEVEVEAMALVLVVGYAMLMKDLLTPMLDLYRLLTPLHLLPFS